MRYKSPIRCLVFGRAVCLYMKWGRRGVVYLECVYRWQRSWPAVAGTAQESTPLTRLPLKQKLKGKWHGRGTCLAICTSMSLSNTASSLPGYSVLSKLPTSSSRCSDTWRHKFDQQLNFFMPGFALKRQDTKCWAVFPVKCHITNLLDSIPAGAGRNPHKPVCLPACLTVWLCLLVFSITSERHPPS